MLHNLFTRFLQSVDSIARNRAYMLLGGVFVLLVTSSIFYTKANRFADVESHIPATILALQYGYDLEGYGLSFVGAKGIEDTYGNGTLRILNEGIVPDSFGHYRSTIGVQGFFYAWLYQTLNLTSFKALYWLNAFLSAMALLVCSILLGRIFGRAFGIIFFLSLFTSGWVANFGGSLYFSLTFWILPAIIAFSLYRMVATQNKLSKTTLTLFCLAYMFAIALRASMSYEFLTSIILFSLSPFIVSFIYGVLTGSQSPFLSMSAKRAFKYGLGLFILACVGFLLTFIIHTYIRGGGDLWAGLMDIYHNDFLRRMTGGNPKDFHPVYADSFNASALEVIKIYLTANTKLLILLCLSIFVCFVESNKSYRNFYIALLICFALPAISWFVLGKSHSYIHRHFCFVLWYLGSWASIIYIPMHYFYRKKIA
ncbi:hypothetical protein LS77_002065 [Helicobacter bilis]|uniref:Glycosyltransferase RgtA/B/C/D-like domain-containing protein n=2 Tax=Helicobacter bilis TaxID=37372 RepID=A0A6D2CJ61_9HELI|nr:hypothetical protein [Helicobacter bilis]EMZ38116.1 hypothetical protein C826_01629 [Helicobacter bilis WiWa]TLE05994.1 hypothetical protein LS77_002065 [Helicobacter bilis]TLE06773.1 hypothetical protein LS76_002225 [Helicobacter bilis]